MITSFISAGANLAVQSVTDTRGYIDSKFTGWSPSLLILGTTVMLVGLTILKKCCQQRWGETRREQAGRLALRVSYVQQKYTQDINKQLVHFQESVRKKWENFGPLFTSIPDEGMDLLSLVELIDNYSKITASALKDKHLSGTIYSKSLDKGFEAVKAIDWNPEMEPNPKTDDITYFSHLSHKLKTIFTYAFNQAHLWNSLHSDEFAVGACIDYQVVRIVASMFGGDPKEVMGFVTSGGTESLMLATRMYREWGMKTRGHEPGEGVVIACQTVHAAISKGGQAYLLNVEMVDSDESGRVNLEHLKTLVKKHGNKVVAIIASAPSYPTGVIDPVEEMAKIAQENGCGLHVDCCLGAFIVNHLAKHKTDFLNIPGVTSLSADTHKNGLAPKGSSTLVTKPLGPENLAYYSIYSIPDWSGGVYGTPKDAGSQSCVQSLNALLALLATGRKGYQRIAKAVHGTALQLAEVIQHFDGKLKLIAQPEVNVVAFQIDKKWGLQKGATYAFAYEMAKRKFILNTLNHDAVHFCVTTRFASDASALKEFKKAVDESLEAVASMNKELEKTGKMFPGDAGMYCALEAAMTPNKKELSTQKFIENLLLGKQGAKDAIRAYFLAQLNPFKIAE